MSAPPPPPPPPCAPPPPKFGAKKQSNNAKPVDRGALLGEIHKGAKLRKADTNDRSAPAVGNKKASPASKYNTIGVHTHRQQQHQMKDTALWRRGSQDGKKSNDSSPRGGGGFPPNKIGGIAGELFPGGIPKLQNKGQKQRIPASNSSPKPMRVPNGPTNQTDIRSQINKNVSNGGSVINDNKTFPQRNVPPTRKFQPPIHPVHTSNDINSNITNNNHSVNVNTAPNPSQHTAGGIAMNVGGGRRMPGTHPPPPPPPPPGRPPSLPNNRTPNKNRPSSMIGRPLPPPPTSSSSSSSLNRAQPPPPPPPTRGPPLPPDRTVSGGGTLPRSKPPAQRPPPPPPTRPPAGPSRSLPHCQEGPSPPQRTASSLSTSSNISNDIVKRGHFHDVFEFPPPEPFSGCAKTYPSRGARNTAGSRRAPPPPPPPPISAVR